MSTAREDARAIFLAAIAAVNPAALVARELRENRQLASAMAKARRIMVVGGGKAGAGMVAGVEEALAGQLDRVAGVVNVPDALVRSTKRIVLNPARPSGCNEPTPAAVTGTESMLTLASAATQDDAILCLLSGGGSALISAPPPGISLRDKIATTRQLTDRGATIAELNCVRKHISRVKGGQLAAASRAGSLWSLILSDVEGDRPDVIASGPTAPDPTTFSEALAIIDRHAPVGGAPVSVVRHLERGVNGEISDTPKHLPDTVRNIVLANNATALDGAQAEAERRGYRVHRSEPVFGETAIAAYKLGNVIRNIVSKCNTPTCILSGGETTVRLQPRHGVGGRNQDLALHLACSLGSRDLARLTIICAGTDGEDGPTDAAGALIDSEVMRAAAANYLAADYFLSRQDSYHFLAATGGLLKTGLTGTNVMDVQIALVHRQVHLADVTSIR